MIKKILSLTMAAVMLLTFLAFPASAITNKIESGELYEFGDFHGLKGKMVYYPKALEEQDGKWPVIAWANGTGCAPALYENLLKGFAKKGYVVVASTELMSADGTDQVDSIDYILECNNDPDSPFYNKIDDTRIAAIGHSQGGRSAVNAAQQDKRIKCVISIAGSNTDGEAEGLTTPTFFITGTADMIVLSALWVKPSYKEVSGPAVYASMKSAVHTTCMTAPNKYIGYCTKWLDAVLNRNADALSTFENGGELSKDTGWKSEAYACKNLDSLKMTYTGSMISEGNVWIIAAGAAIIVSAIVFAVKKKKKGSEE